MRFIKNTKANVVAGDAQKAWDSDSKVSILNMPSTHPGPSGRIEDWEVMLNAILDVGRTLHTWAVCSDKRGRPQAQPLFTRPGT